MFARVAFFLITVFWVTMNALLWRAEYGARNASGSAVPVGVVWRKMLTAPDSSSLSIFRHGQKIGFCHWVTSVGEEFSKMEEAPPEGMSSRPGNYRIQFDGNVTLPESDSRLRFESALKLSTNQFWQELNVRLSLRPVTWEIHTVAAEQTVRVKSEGADNPFNRVFRFSELQHPDALLNEFVGPFSLTLLKAIGLPAVPQNAVSLDSAMHWEARYDTLTIGHEPVRVYRLQTKLLDRFPAKIFVSRAGEILRAELPDGIVLTHDQLGAF